MTNAPIDPAEDLLALEQFLEPHEVDELKRLRATLTGDFDIPFCPYKPYPAQRRFLACMEKEALYGGALAGGKSMALLMAALMYVDRFGYNAVLVRKTYSDLNQPKALMDMARHWLTGTGATFSQKDARWTFPSGATLGFRHLESDHDLTGFQGAEYHFIGIDEAGQHNKVRYDFLMQRLRKDRTLNIPIRMRVTANPGGIGHEFLKKKFVDPETANCAYFPATMYDNFGINVEDYLDTLKHLSEIDRQMMIEGKWVHDKRGLVYICDESKNIVKEIPQDKYTAVIGVDLGSSEKKKTTGFAVGLWSKYRPESYIAEAWAESALTPASIAEICMETQERWGEDTAIVMDEGALGRGYANEMRSRYNLPVVPAVKKDKNGYIKLLNGDLYNERLKISITGAAPLIKEWSTLMWDDSGVRFVKHQDDHISDAALYAWRYLRNWQGQEVRPAEKMGVGWEVETQAIYERAMRRDAMPWWKK